MKLVAAVLLCLGAVSAQVTTSTIYGTVLDPTSAAIPNARISATNAGTGLSWSVIADGAGQFTLTFLPVGSYSVTVEAAGFKDAQRTGIDLSAGEKVQLTFSLQVGAASDKVTVVGEAPLLNVVSAEQNSAIESTQVRELPSARRDWTSFLNIGAGVAVVAVSNASSVVTMNGLPPQGFRFTIDGTDSQANPGLTSMSMFGNYNFIKGVSLESIAEVNVTKGIASAENANSMSGGVNLTTRGGTNQFHGSLFENNQTENLNARNQFLTFKAPLVFNQFGGSIGGPILHNKLFFFGAYEGYRQSAFAAQNGSVPTQEFRDRAIAAVPAYKDFFAIWPLPNSPVKPGDVTGTYVGAASNTAHDNHADVRVDYQISRKDLLTARYTGGAPFQETPRVYDNPRDFTGTAKVGTMAYTRAGQSLVAQTRFGYNFSDVLRLDLFYNRNIPAIACDCGFSGSGETNGVAGHSWSVEEVIGKNSGPHALKWGVLFIRPRINAANVQVPSIQYSTAATLLANQPSTATFTYGVGPYALTTWQLGGFVQDDFRVRKNLTLNIGVRYDYYAVPRANEGAQLFSRGAPFGFGALRSSDSLYDANFTNFSPRAGFAWSLGSNAQTVIRAGAGIFFSPPQLNSTAQPFVNNAVDQPFRFIFNSADVQRLGLKYPATNASTLQYVINPDAPWSLAAVNSHFPSPYGIQWTFSIQRQLTRSMSLESSYVGSGGVKIISARYMNNASRQTGQVPNPRFGTFIYYDNADHSHYHSWQTILHKRMSSSLLFDANYTWSKEINYGGGNIVDSGDSLRPQDPFNLRAERGPAPYDVTHRFSADAVYELPFLRWTTRPAGPLRLLLGGWQAGALLNVSSGLPIAILQSSAINGSRPDYLGGSPTLSNYRDTLQYLNPAAFARVPVVAASGATARPGTVGRDDVRLPGFWNTDLSLSKNVQIREAVRFQLRTDMFNAFNHTYFTTITSEITNKAFGRLTAASSRVVQINARFTF